LSREKLVTEKPRDEGAIFGPHLRALRLKRGLTQAQLADGARSNVIFISRLERGVTTPTLGMLLRLAEALDCQVTNLVKVFNSGPHVSPRSRKD
jgi:transcriptional regulator with XRE-family HTH domain